jgi:hypothetical protein
MLERVRNLRLALETDVLWHAAQHGPPSVDDNIVDALRRARTEFERVELQLEAELREGTRDLTCVECSETSSGDTAHWKAYLTSDNQVAIFCPDCAAFELEAGR